MAVNYNLRMIEYRDEKKISESFSRIRIEDNLKRIRTLSVLTGVFTLVFAILFYFRSTQAQVTQWNPYYRNSFLILSFLSFLIRYLYFLLNKKGKKILLNKLVYFYLLLAYFTLINISVWDSRVASDFLAYALAILTFSFVYRAPRRRLITTHLVGMVYFILAYYYFFERWISPLFLLPLVAFFVFAYYISSSREKTQQKLHNLAMELEKSHEEIKEISLRDPMTGLYNRRYSDDFITYQFERYARTGALFSILLFDVDNFKSINDDFGHNTGDDVLKEMATATMNAIRKTDLGVRYGGEEFLIVLTDTNLTSAEIIAERLRKNIEEISFAGIPRPVTVSLGVTEVVKGDTQESLLARADKNLYQAKKSGRNRFVSSI